MKQLEKLLKIQDIIVETEKEQKKIINGISFEVNEGETVVILGPNGAGKSTLGAALMGDRRYKITRGKIEFCGQEVSMMDTDKRALLGMMMTMQSPVEIPGISTTEVIRNALMARGERLPLDTVRERISTVCKKLKTNIFFAERDLNVQFSGGEKKKNEILQAMVLKPKLLILDEIDSGLDVDATEKISEMLAELAKETRAAFLVITHNMRVLKHLSVDKVLVLKDGKIVRTGGDELVREVETEGFQNL